MSKHVSDILEPVKKINVATHMTINLTIMNLPLVATSYELFSSIESFLSSRLYGSFFNVVLDTVVISLTFHRWNRKGAVRRVYISYRWQYVTICSQRWGTRSLWALWVHRVDRLWKRDWTKS